jgi:predicted  nucleic acid-binding Zn-ribbon protein
MIAKKKNLIYGISHIKRDLQKPQKQKPDLSEEALAKVTDKEDLEKLQHTFNR